MDVLKPLTVDMLPLIRSPKAILVESKFLKIKNFNRNADLQNWSPAEYDTYQASHGNVGNKYKLLLPTTTYIIVAI